MQKPYNRNGENHNKLKTTANKKLQTPYNKNGDKLQIAVCFVHSRNTFFYADFPLMFLPDEEKKEIGDYR